MRGSSDTRWVQFVVTQKRHWLRYPYRTASLGHDMRDVYWTPKGRRIGSCRHAPHNLVQQALSLLLQLQDVGADFRQRAQRRGLVEVAGKRNLVANLGL